MMTTETLPEITIGIAAIGEMTTRKWLLSWMEETGCKARST